MMHRQARDVSIRGANIVPLYHLVERLGFGSMSIKASADATLYSHAEIVTHREQQLFHGTATQLYHFLQYQKTKDHQHQALDSLHTYMYIYTNMCIYVHIGNTEG